MEKLLTQIGELVATEIDNVKSIEYVDKETGYMFYITLDNGKKNTSFPYRITTLKTKKRQAYCLPFFYFFTF